MIDENLRKKMEMALDREDYDTALELSRELDKQIAFLQKLKSIEVMIIFQS